MKNKILKLFNAKTERRKQLIEKGNTCNSVDELRSINTEIEALNEEIRQLQEVLDSMEDEDPGLEGNRGQINPPQLNPIATYGVRGRRGQSNEEEDIFGTLEYRQAFRNFVVNGTPIPEEYRAAQQEQREDALTVVGDIGAVIPTNILNRVIEDLTVEGKLLSRITQTSYQGGVEIPISEVIPEAHWLGSESEVSDEQKAEMNAKITFGYHVLEAKVAVGLLSATVSLPIFESTIVKQLKKAMIRAIETSIVAGTGTGQPKGFTKYELPTEQIIEMTEKNIGTVKAWAEVEGKIPEEYEDDVIYVMSKPTWEKYLNGMTDTTGQKIGLGKINEKGQKILNGREVLTIGNFKSFDAASDGEIFGAVINLSEYLLNSNLAMYYKKYFNEDKNKWIHKCLMIADGQMAIGKDSKSVLRGAKGLLYLKKKVVSS